MVNLRLKRKLAAKVLGVGVERIWFDPEANEDLEGLDTREDVRALEARGIMRVLPIRGQTRKKKGRKGPGSRKGKKTVKVSKKDRWMIRVRAQRRLLRTLREKGTITPSQYRHLYSRVKGGMFRSKARLSDYMDYHVLKIKTKTR